MPATPVPNTLDRTKFHIYANNGTDALVTRDSSEPFIFYPQPRYIHESPAKFHLLNLSGGIHTDNKAQRGAITNILKRIWQGYYGDNTEELYEELFRFMEMYGHLEVT